MKLERTVTASHAFDVDHALIRHSIWKCDECKALIEKEDFPEHVAWHSTLLHAPDLSARAREGRSQQ